MKSSQAILTTVLSLTGQAIAFWRMPCRSQTGIARIDPLVDPGEISAHVHTITGGGGFGFNANYDTLTSDGSCTACEVTQDHSAYWTPTLNFIHSNGTMVMVPQVGGMLAYYLYYLENIKAFPEGFQMIAGDYSVRNFTGPFPDIALSFWNTNSTNDQYFLQQRAIGFNCLNYAVAPEPSLYRHVMPSKDYLDANCADGLRLELAFPSCGNGSIDSSDHKSHMAYPSLVKEGNCPDGYDVHYPFLFYETIWATNAFAGQKGNFVLSYGDPIGTGYHGDFIMGWESEGFLQNALDTCQDESGEIQDCPLFNIQSDAEAAKCTFEMPDALKHDNPEGPRNGLAVDVPIQYGPEEATTFPIAGRKGQMTTTLQPSDAPSTFTQQTVTYSSANPSLTSTAEFGIIVAKVSTTSTAIADKVAASTMVSVAPPPDSEVSSQAGFLTTNYITSGNTVVEMFVTKVDVTVTATATTSPDTRRRRHLHKHVRAGRI